MPARKPVPRRPVTQLRPSTCPPTYGAPPRLDRILPHPPCAMRRKTAVSVTPVPALANGAPPAHGRIRDKRNTPKHRRSRPSRSNHSDNEIMRWQYTRSFAMPHRIAPDPQHAPPRQDSASAPLSARRPPAPVHDVARRRSRDDVRRPTGSSPASASGTSARGRSAHIRHAAALRRTTCD